MHDGLRLTDDHRERALVNTLTEYKSATARGFYAVTTFEMAVAYESFERPLAILDAVGVTNIGEASFIDDPRLGLADIALLPATLLFVTRT